MARGRSTQQRRRPRRGPALRVALQVLAVAVVAFFFYRERHVFAGFTSSMGRLRWSWIALSFVAELVSIPPLAEAQLVVFRAGGAREVARWEMTLVTFASNAISMSIPAGVAVAEGYAYAKYRRFGATRALAAWAELASGAIAFAALAGVALAGAIVAGGGAERVLVPTLAVVFAGSMAAAALFRRPRLLVAAVDWLAAHIGRRLGGLVARTARRIRDVAHDLTDVRPGLRTWGAAFAYSALNWLLDVACLVFAFEAVGASVPWGAVLLAFAGSKVVSSIGITPGGLGIVEGGLVATFVAYGTKGSTAAAAVLVYRAVTFVGLVGLGWLVAVALAVKAQHEEGG